MARLAITALLATGTALVPPTTRIASHKLRAVDEATGERLTQAQIDEAADDLAIAESEVARRKDQKRELQAAYRDKVNEADALGAALARVTPALHAALANQPAARVDAARLAAEMHAEKIASPFVAAASSAGDGAAGDADEGDGARGPGDGGQAPALRRREQRGGRD